MLVIAAGKKLMIAAGKKLRVIAVSVEMEYH